MGLPACRFMVSMAQVYQRPIWVTEMACGLTGNFTYLTIAMKQLLTMLDTQPMVARCAYLNLNLNLNKRSAVRGASTLTQTLHIMLVKSLPMVVWPGELSPTVRSSFAKTVWLH